MLSQQNFENYPDILSVSEFANLLGVSKKTAYKVISDQKIACIKVGRAYKIPKMNVLKFLLVD